MFTLPGYRASASPLSWTFWHFALRVIVHTSDDIGVELKGVRSGVERRRGASGLKARGDGRRDAGRRREKSSRIGVHRADAAAWEPA
jgi:hypothetical protein